MDSIWGKTYDLPEFPSLKEEESTDVVVIGGGITGILCSYFLKQDGVNCILVEADRICSGTTKNTTAKITFQHGLIYDELISKKGIELAKLYFSSQREALSEYSNMCKYIDCDYKEDSSFVYTLNSPKNLERELYAYERLGCRADFVNPTHLPFSTAGAVRVDGQAQFNPLKFVQSIVQDLCIYEKTRVLSIDSRGVVTDRGRINCKKVIVATHFPFINKHGAFFMKMYQHRSYVIAINRTDNIHGMYIDEADGGMSFREYGDMLLIGGGSHRTGKKGGGWRELIDFAQRYYARSDIKYQWATQDCMTLDKIPYIGRYSKATPNVYVATGFNKWGMTSSMVSALILRDLIQGRSNKYASLYDPSRNMLQPQLAVNTFESVCGLLRPTVPRCSHLGCALKYNAQEHSWDCSCHGSRFSEDGKLIDNPALKDIKTKNSR